MNIPKDSESKHILLLGDSGTGKSQVIHQFLKQIARRKPAESVVIYDPACEFARAHFNRARGDIVINPLDARSPFWSPSAEVLSYTDLKMIAESFFPGKEGSFNSSSQFFVGASRAIFGRMLEWRPSPQTIVEWLKSEGRIDEIVAGTEYAHYITPGAGPQRGGVLASLAAVGDTLKLLPAESDCASQISLSRWGLERKGWIFMTATKATRDQLKPLYAAYIDLLMKRLMSVPPEYGSRRPCWVVVDEVQTLKRLPALHDAVSEGRKFGLRLVMGTVNKAEFEDNYGKVAATILATPRLKILFRCGEPESAKWVAELIGDEERERLKIGTTATVDKQGRDSINYSTYQDRRPAISKEQIMGLEDLHGVWRFEKYAVPFRIEFDNLPAVTEEYRPRKLEVKTPEPPPPHNAKPPKSSQGKAEAGKKENSDGKKETAKKNTEGAKDDTEKTGERPRNEVEGHAIGKKTGAHLYIVRPRETPEEDLIQSTSYDTEGFSQDENQGQRGVGFDLTEIT